MSIAKALLGLIGTAILGLLATYIMIPEWVLVNLEQHPWQTVCGFVISAVFGGAVVFIAYATLMSIKLGSNPCKAFDDLKRIDELKACKSLSDAAEQVGKLDSKCSELKRQLSARDAEIAALRSAKVPTPLDMLKASLGDEGIASFRALCAASTYADGRPARPLVFDLDDAKLKAVGLTARMVQHMADVGAIRLVASDERELVGSDACPEMVDLGDGVSASASTVRFSLAGGECVEVGPVRMSWGTDVFIVDGRLSGADLGIASFTEEGAELAAECAAAKPPFGMGGYIEKAYSEEMRVSRNRFRCLTEDGDLVAR